jgi:hypothetical protein
LTPNPAWFAANQQRHKVECADLTLELRAGIAGRRRRRDLRQGRIILGHVLKVLEIRCLRNLIHRGLGRTKAAILSE